MDFTLFVYPIVLIVLISLSSIYSMIEMALSSSSSIKLQNIANDKKNKKSKKALKAINFQKKYSIAMTTIVLSNNLVNILITMLSTIWFTSLISDGVIAGIVSFVVTTLVIVLVCEILPKYLGRKYPETIFLFFLTFLDVSIFLLKPFTFFINKISKDFSTSILTSKSELQLALQESNKQNITSPYENQIFQKVLNLTNEKIKKIILKDKEIISIESNINKTNLHKKIIQFKKTRMPVYEEKDIVAIFNTQLYFLDRLNENKKKKEKFDIFKYTYKPVFLEADTNLSEALSILQNQNTKMAVVIDANQQHLGIITLEDILEEVFGEFFDENDILDQDIFFRSKKTLVVKSHLNIFEAITKLNKKQASLVPIDERSLTIEQWAKKHLKVVNFENIKSFNYNKLLIWVNKIHEFSKDYYFEIDLIN